MAGEIIENQTLTGTVLNADGNIYKNCTFEPYCLIMGDGITFIDCQFNSNCNSNPPQMILIPGTGSVLQGGMVKDPCTIFGNATVVGRDVLWLGIAAFFSNIQGGDMQYSKPVVHTNDKCSQKVTGKDPPKIVEFCWNERRRDNTQSTTGTRTGGS